MDAAGGCDAGNLEIDDGDTDARPYHNRHTMAAPLAG